MKHHVEQSPLGEYLICRGASVLARSERKEDAEEIVGSLNGAGLDRWHERYSDGERNPNNGGERCTD